MGRAITLRQGPILPAQPLVRIPEAPPSPTMYAYNDATQIGGGNIAVGAVHIVDPEYYEGSPVYEWVSLCGYKRLRVPASAGEGPRCKKCNRFALAKGIWEPER